MVASDFEESLEDSPTRKLLDVIPSKHMFEGVWLAFQPKFTRRPNILSDIVELRFASGVNDVRLVGKSKFANAFSELPVEEVIQRLESVKVLGIIFGDEGLEKRFVRKNAPVTPSA